MTDTTTAMLAMLPGAPGEAQLLGAISRLPAGAYITAPAKRETAGYRLQGPVAVIQISARWPITPDGCGAIRTSPAG